jgi:hypothetical protein
LGSAAAAALWFFSPTVPPDVFREREPGRST